MLRLSILDQSPIAEGFSASQALENSLDLARTADHLGYHRYWVAEHHGTPALACTSPEILIGAIAAATKRMRVGSGGVMLPHYSPLKVAEVFSMLSGLHPGRIDLGIGRAAGTGARVTFALQRDRRQGPPDDFRQQLEELLAYVGYVDSTGLGLPVAPEVFHFDRTDPYLLGSSPQSAIWAAELGLPYVFADFIQSEGASIAEIYRDRFEPSRTLDTPQTAVALWAICADTDEEAHRLSLSSRMMLTLLNRGRLIAVPSPETAERFLAHDDLPTNLLLPKRRLITGTARKVRQSIEEAAREYQAEEVFVVNILYDHQARRRSYELLAAEFDLPGAPVHASASLQN